MVPRQASRLETCNAWISCNKAISPLVKELRDLVVLVVSKEDTVNLQLNKNGVVNLISEIQTQILQMVATIVVIQTTFYLYSHISPRSID